MKFILYVDEDGDIYLHEDEGNSVYVDGGDAAIYSMANLLAIHDDGFPYGEYDIVITRRPTPKG